MKKTACFGLFVFATSITATFAQNDRTKPFVSPTPSRVVVTSTMPPIAPPKPLATPVPTPIASPVRTQTPQTTPMQMQMPNPGGLPQQQTQASNLNYKGLSFAQIKSKIAEAKRQMQTRPITTVMTEPSLAPGSGLPGSTAPVAVSPLVRIAYYDWRDKKIDYIVISKDAFLTANSPTGAISTNGHSVTTQSIRANGVNTPIIIKDENGQAQLPLLIQYPVEKDGRFVETAYYMSTHPGLVTPEVVSAGRLYVHNVVEIARDQLRNKGYAIQPKVADIAERLATVEHVDHLRFRSEFQSNIFNDIFTLYALNEGQTYRYSVSSAGAGGMVQMIPSTYRLVRSRFPNAGLMPDFVEGMRNHVNATQAMLLYMQMTWNDLSANPTVSNAMQTGLATQEQLMAAGYNSNPAKLAGYINRGGENWTTLIPRETKIYLQIWDALARDVFLTPRMQ